MERPRYARTGIENRPFIVDKYLCQRMPAPGFRIQPDHHPRPQPRHLRQGNQRPRRVMAHAVAAQDDLFFGAQPALAQMGDIRSPPTHQRRRLISRRLAVGTYRIDNHLQQRPRAPHIVHPLGSKFAIQIIHRLRRRRHRFVQLLQLDAAARSIRRIAVPPRVHTLTPFRHTGVFRQIHTLPFRLISKTIWPSAQPHGLYSAGTRPGRSVASSGSRHIPELIEASFSHVNSETPAPAPPRLPAGCRSIVPQPQPATPTKRRFLPHKVPSRNPNRPVCAAHIITCYFICNHSSRTSPYHNEPNLPPGYRHCC